MNRNAYQREWAKAHPESRKASVYKWVAVNREIVKTHHNKWVKANPEKAQAASTKWIIENRDKFRERRRRYYIKNKGKILAETEQRRGRIKNDIRGISPAYQAEIDGMYMFCNVFKEYQVDHIIPLKHKQVCGLHVPANLQLLTAAENARKGNCWSQGV